MHPQWDPGHFFFCVSFIFFLSFSSLHLRYFCVVGNAASVVSARYSRIVSLPSFSATEFFSIGGVASLRVTEFFFLIRFGRRSGNFVFFFDRPAVTVAKKKSIFFPQKAAHSRKRWGDFGLRLSPEVAVVFNGAKKKRQSMATVIDRTRRGSLLFIGRFPSTSQSQRSVRVLRLRRGSSAKKKTSRTKDAEEKRRAPHLLDEVGFEKTSFEWKSTPTIERRPIRKVLARLTVETLVITASVLYVRR